MGASCKGICTQNQITKVPNSQKYQFGLKRCSWCEVWLDTNEIRCECCKMILRTKARNKKISIPKTRIINLGENTTLWHEILD